MSLLTDVRDDPGTRCNAVGLSANLGLACLKFTIGTLAGSQALIADGYNSAGDLVATGIAAAGYRYAQRPADADHPFGHGNADNLAGLVVGAILFSTGVFVTLEGARELVTGTYEVPGSSALVAIGVTAAVKEALFRYTTRVGREVGSQALLASARDHRADVWIAGAVFAGVLGARAGLPWLDPAAAAAIGGYIAFMAWKPIRENLGVLMDESPPELTERIRLVALEDPEAFEVRRVRCHPLSGHYLVDLVIALDGSVTLDHAAEVARRVEQTIATRFEEVDEVTAQVVPR